jgi:hypothetical protein
MLGRKFPSHLRQIALEMLFELSTNQLVVKKRPILENNFERGREYAKNI